jgi:hypothetical protein
LIAPARKGALKREVRRECGESRFRSVERGKADVRFRLLQRGHGLGESPRAARQIRLPGVETLHDAYDLRVPEAVHEPGAATN